MKHLSATATVALLCLISASTSFGQDEQDGNWPKEITVPQGKVIIYQPQPEALDGNILTGRGAVAIEENGADGPVFGALWFSARLETDRSQRTATLADMTVIRSRFPDGVEDRSAGLGHHTMPTLASSVSVHLPA